MRTYSVTDTGILREMNQDFCFASEQPVGNLPNLFIVADGMGGHRAGDYASRFTTHRIVASVTRNKEKEPISILKEAITTANQILMEEAREDEEKYGMGTTIVAATILADRLCVANIGDSRLYVVGDGIRQVTVDHSYVEEMIRRGKVDANAAKRHPNKNIITRAIGATEDVEADFFEVELAEGEKILLCTDGLTNMVDDTVICEIMRSGKSPEEKARQLVDLANQNGGRDNITVVIVEP
ncbi:MAG: Stp1/IreP family PP2C-type Ser/Thr phosphatase [Agathobacter sp.]|nr:Stp1/IreP family PP2C-type Ser/Thr phosphatase [Agathobacter sp.]